MHVIAASEIPLYAGPKITSNWGIREEVRIFENAFEEVSSKEEVYSRPALKKYGEMLGYHQHNILVSLHIPERRSLESTHRPDFNVNSPKRRTPFFSAASINATFSASTAVVVCLATLMLGRGRLQKRWW
jgi:hypothetical protein